MGGPPSAHFSFGGAARDRRLAHPAEAVACGARTDCTIEMALAQHSCTSRHGCSHCIYQAWGRSGPSRCRGIHSCEWRRAKFRKRVRALPTAPSSCRGCFASQAAPTEHDPGDARQDLCRRSHRSRAVAFRFRGPPSLPPPPGRAARPGQSAWNCCRGCCTTEAEAAARIVNGTRRGRRGRCPLRTAQAAAQGAAAARCRHLG